MLNPVVIENHFINVDVYIRIIKANCTSQADAKLFRPEFLPEEGGVKDIIYNAIENHWDSIEEMGLKELITSFDGVEREILFRLMPVAKIYKDYNKKEIDTFTFNDDKYILYAIDLEGFGFADKVEQKILRMWCPSTGEEYWEYVHPDTQRARDAVASRVYTWYDEKDITDIYRQGEVIAFKLKSKDCKQLNEQRPINVDFFFKHIREQT